MTFDLHSPFDPELKEVDHMTAIWALLEKGKE